MSPPCVLNLLFLYTIPLNNLEERSTTFPFPHEPMISRIMGSRGNGNTNSQYWVVFVHIVEK